MRLLWASGFLGKIFSQLPKDFLMMDLKKRRPQIIVYINDHIKAFAAQIRYTIVPKGLERYGPILLSLSEIKTFISETFLDVTFYFRNIFTHLIFFWQPLSAFLNFTILEWIIFYSPISIVVKQKYILQSMTIFKFPDPPPPLQPFHSYIPRDQPW
jgi:hypothetical protein